MKDMIYWAITNTETQAFQGYTVNPYRKKAIELFLAGDDGKPVMTWREAKKYDWRAVKVKITICE